MSSRMNLIALGAILLFGTACTGPEVRQACHNCPQKTQSWNAFSFEQLEGTWRGTKESLSDDIDGIDSVRKSKSVEVSFLMGDKFLRVYKVDSGTCKGFPKQSIVLLNELWWDKSGKRYDERAFEVFGKMDADKVSFGRAYIRRRQGKAAICSYEQIGRAVPMNRLSLPHVNYSRRMTSNGRVLASGGTEEVDVNFEFLHFAKATIEERYQWKHNDKKTDPPLFFRFVRSTRKVQTPFDHGRWMRTDESLYRLWPVDK